MKLGLFITIAIAGFLFYAKTSFAHECNQQEKLRPKQREIRGFKPDHMSTAYGFGKREIPKQNSFEKIMTLLQHFPRSVTIHWLVREMNRNPEFAIKVWKMIIADEEPDKATTGELFKAEQALSYV